MIWAVVQEAQADAMRQRAGGGMTSLAPRREGGASGVTAWGGVWPRCQKPNLTPTVEVWESNLSPSTVPVPLAEITW